MKAANREYGIDLLRILSMLMVVILHTLGNGGVLNNVKAGSVNYYVAWLMEIAVLCAVDCFALISGYVLYKPGFKLSRLIELWFQVFFYSVAITAVFFVIDRHSVSAKDVVLGIAPVLTKRYWYFTAYVGLFFFTPFINRAIDSFDKATAQKLITAVILLLSVFPALTTCDLFMTNTGYSMIWLIALYFIGAYIKKYNPFPFLKKRNLLFYAVCVIAALTFKVVIEMIPFKFSCKSTFSNNFVHYTSPFILLAAVFLLLFFSQLHINSKSKINLISFFSPISFGVYLIQVHPQMWTKVFLNRFVFLASSPTLILVLGTLVFSAAVYISLALLDFMRQCIFKLIKIHRLSEYIGANISRWFDSLFPKDIQK